MLKIKVFLHFVSNSFRAENYVPHELQWKKKYRKKWQVQNPTEVKVFCISTSGSNNEHIYSICRRCVWLWWHCRRQNQRWSIHLFIWNFLWTNECIDNSHWVRNFFPSLFSRHDVSIYTRLCLCSKKFATLVFVWFY